jgi:hypothetical protein
MTVRLLEHWSPPQHAGRPVACLATTFTFDADFFAQDCLSRFLSLSTGTGDGDRISTIASILEEEDRLAETQVTVLADRSTRTQKRNLRWDLLPVAVPGGLLHAKVAVLIWEHHCRVLLGSANLTAAAYRQQVEFGLALDIGAGCQVPRTVFTELVDELRDLVGLSPGQPETGPKARALATLALFQRRIDAADLPDGSVAGLHIALAPGRPGLNPLDRHEAVWRGGKPLRATVLSPFWDDQTPAPALDAVRRLLTGRPAQSRQLTILADISPFTGKVQGPPSLLDQGAQVYVYKRPDSERRTLHAKLVLLESDTWVAAMVGSSNLTEAGLGLSEHFGHRELNLWIGCDRGSAEGKALRALAATDGLIRPDAQQWETTADEDEVTWHELPSGFVDCLLHLQPEPAATLTLDPAGLPAVWRILDPAGHPVYDSAAWSAAGSSPVRVTLPPGMPLPSFLVVRWHVDGQEVEATWTANIDDRTALPPPSELREIPVHALLAALASTRPLPLAVEHELRRLERVAHSGADLTLDPLARYDKAHLLQRARQSSLALMRLQERLARPASNLDAVRWRLHGALGPLTLAESIAATPDEQVVNGEKHFMLAELALTIAAVDWATVLAGAPRDAIRQEVTAALEQIREQTKRLPSSRDSALDRYVHDAVEEALARCGR